MAKSTTAKYEYSLLPDADEDDALLAHADDLSPPDLDADFDLESGRERQRDPARSFPPAIDPRFEQPTPALWKRLALLLFIVLCFFVAFQLQVKARGGGKRKGGAGSGQYVGVRQRGVVRSAVRVRPISASRTHNIPQPIPFTLLPSPCIHRQI
ncbi:hypothetical protein B0H12DRAFT_1239241 [Mycena haematopus]|nr:hypothetical protein B0H12DRAFT_1239241 [Mycena haematopus]